MKKLDKKAFNLIKVYLIIVSVVSCGMYYVLYNDDFNSTYSYEISKDDSFETEEYVFETYVKENDVVSDEKESIKKEDSTATIKSTDDEEAYNEEMKININTASEDLLQELNNIGPVVASKIVEYRELNGPFKNIEDIMNVKGIGKAKFGLIKDSITVNE